MYTHVLLQYVENIDKVRSIQRKVNRVKVHPVSNSRLEKPRGNSQVRRKRQLPRRKPLLTNKIGEKERNTERMYKIQDDRLSNVNIWQILWRDSALFRTLYCINQSKQRKDR